MTCIRKLVIPALFPPTNVRLTYDYSRSRTDYLYQPGTPIADRTL